MKYHYISSIVVGTLVAWSGFVFVESFVLGRQCGVVGNGARPWTFDSANVFFTQHRAAAKSSDSNDNTKNNGWKQQPGESEFAYLKRLQQLASAPTVVEPSSLSPTNASMLGAIEEKEEKKGYTRIEDWDKQQKTNLTWEEKVQFDGQRQGNRVVQNDILRKAIGWDLW
jgi:hypothetical protein